MSSSLKALGAFVLPKSLAPAYITTTWASVPLLGAGNLTERSF